MTKNGRAHAAALRDGRELYIYGHRVPDVTSHPAFTNTVASAAASVRSPYTSAGIQPADICLAEADRAGYRPTPPVQHGR